MIFNYILNVILKLTNISLLQYFMAKEQIMNYIFIATE